MTVALQVVLPPPAAAGPDPRQATKLLSVTVHLVRPGAVVVTARGEVDLVTSSLLRQRLLGNLYGPAMQLIVDLTEVRFFGAAGLTVLAIVRRASLETGTRLSLVARTRPVLLPLMIASMHTAFDIYPDISYAIASRGPERTTP